MSDSSSKQWSDDLDAPQIPDWLPFAEKANFAGILIAGVLYGTLAYLFVKLDLPFYTGIVVIFFFQCMGLLMGSAGRTKRGIRWGLVAHTTAIFSFVTIFTATNLDLLSISYIDNREFLGEDMAPPGPFGYQFLVFSKPINITPYIMFFLNSWLADGLLVSSTLKPVVQSSDLGHSPSSTVAVLFIL